jgi:hypothetical protein
MKCHALRAQVILARIRAGFFLRYIARMRLRKLIFVLLSHAVWLTHAPYALGNPQPIGMFIESSTPINETVDDFVVDYERLILHERRVVEAKALEQRLGPYSSQLAENWLELAHEAVDLGQRESASALFQKGLHNVRLNAGLTTNKQLSALTDWIAVLRRMGNQTALVQQLDYRYRITGYGAAPWDDDRLTYALQYFDYQLALLAVSEWRREESQVIKLAKHLEGIVEAACGGSNANRQACLQLTKRRLQLLYLISFAVQPITADPHLSPFNTQRELNEPTISEEKLLSIHRNAYQTGVKMLNRGIDYLGGSDELELVLADWRWFNGKTTQARKMYERLANVLPAEFVLPVALPHGLIEEKLHNAVSDEERTATFSFDVTANGNARNIVEQADEKKQRSTSRLRKHLKQLKFRPVVAENGTRIKMQVTRSYWKTR